MNASGGCAEGVSVPEHWNENWTLISRESLLGMMVLKQAQRDLNSSDPAVVEDAKAFLLGEGEEGMLEMWCASANLDVKEVGAIAGRHLRRQGRNSREKTVGGDDVFAWGLDPAELEERFAEFCQEGEDEAEEAGGQTPPTASETNDGDEGECE